LVKKAPILILDEPTSNLDAESEDVFMQALYKIHAERKTTIIIITHRLRSTLYADNIIVLKQGKVKESGSHSKLLQQNGWYAKVWKMQELENLESI
jgi:ABC-type multidrug transport system fused ATPase/permease subunit